VIDRTLAQTAAHRQSRVPGSDDDCGEALDGLSSVAVMKRC